MQINTLLQYLIPQHLLSRGLGCLANCHNYMIKKTLINAFTRRYQVDLNLAVRETIGEYDSFNDFFTRRLKPTVRPINQSLAAIVSPVDGCIAQFGKVEQTTLIQAKGLEYDLAQLLGDTSSVNDFKNGEYMTLYLSPSDYHRIHMPMNGRLVKVIGLPGKLFSVNASTAKDIPNLYTKNERVVCLFETTQGLVAVILIGAMIVAGIHTVWQGRVNDKLKTKKVWDYGGENIILNKGDELGYFEFGSTVIMLFQPKKIEWFEELSKLKKINFGEKIGTIVIPAKAGMTIKRR